MLTKRNNPDDKVEISTSNPNGDTVITKLEDITLILGPMIAYIFDKFFS